MMQKHIELEAAIAMMQTLQVSPEVEVISLEQAVDRVLAQDIYAAFPMPSFDKSPFDGFAFCASDVPGTLEITNTIAAGAETLPVFHRGTAVRIFTGAPVPKGADVILKFEDTVFDKNSVTIETAVKAGTNVIRAGEDYASGSLLLKKGQRLTPPRLGVIASQGMDQIAVFKKPNVTILDTGTELCALGKAKKPYEIYNSSYYALRGYLQRMGFEVNSPEILSDDPEAILQAVQAQMNSCADLVITTGGASVGDYDYALSTAERIGAEILFWKVNIKPGGALLVSKKTGKKQDKLFLGLSGNPAAAIMGLLLVLQPYLRAMTGETTGNQRLRLPIFQDMPKTSSATRLLRGHLRIAEGLVYFEENLGRGNGNMTSFQNCSLIAAIPGHFGPIKAGTMVEVFQLPEDLCY